MRNRMPHAEEVVQASKQGKAHMLLSLSTMFGNREILSCEQSWYSVMINDMSYASGQYVMQTLH